MSHTLHPDITTHGLSDTCPRCSQIARYPERSLDSTNIALLIDRIAQREEPRSMNEAQAMERFQHAASIVKSLTPDQRYDLGIS
jgi:hypothetical protein